MAIYHCTAKVIGRSAGRSSVAAAAYRAGEKIKNLSDGSTHDYTKKSGVWHTEILLCKDAPIIFQNRAFLWNEVEKTEKRKDAQLAREIEIALPVEFNPAERLAAVREYVQKCFVDKGMIADMAIHDKDDGNPHAHIMLTTREVTQEGFGKKNRDWNSRELIDEWRQGWANVCNPRLDKYGEKIDHRTLEAQGIERVPQIHVGATATAMAKKRGWPDKEKVVRFRDNKHITDYNGGRFDNVFLVELLTQDNKYDSRYVWKTEDAVNRLERNRTRAVETKLPAREPEPAPVVDEQAQRRRELEQEKRRVKQEIGPLTEDKEKIDELHIRRADLQVKIKEAKFRDRNAKKAWKYNLDLVEKEMPAEEAKFRQKHGFGYEQADKKIKEKWTRIEDISKEIRSTYPPPKPLAEQLAEAREIAAARNRGRTPPSRSRGGPSR